MLLQVWGLHVCLQRLHDARLDDVADRNMSNVQLPRLQEAGSAAKPDEGRKAEASPRRNRLHQDSERGSCSDGFP